MARLGIPRCDCQDGGCSKNREFNFLGEIERQTKRTLGICFSKKHVNSCLETLKGKPKGHLEYVSQ